MTYGIFSSAEGTRLNHPLRVGQARAVALSTYLFAVKIAVGVAAPSRGPCPAAFNPSVHRDDDVEHPSQKGRRPAAIATTRSTSSGLVDLQAGEVKGASRRRSMPYGGAFPLFTCLGRRELTLWPKKVSDRTIDFLSQFDWFDSPSPSSQSTPARDTVRFMTWAS